jgi:hypothetical protein
MSHDIRASILNHNFVLATVARLSRDSRAKIARRSHDVHMKVFSATNWGRVGDCFASVLRLKNSQEIF